MCKSSKYDKEEPKKKEETKGLLTALIFMQGRKPRIRLSTLYRLDPEAFTKHNLIRSLYE